MNGKRNSPADGQETSGTANELHADDGVSRRVFLGAAGALSTLPAVGGTTVADEQEDANAEAANTDEKEITIEDGKVTASAEIGPANMHTPPGWFDDIRIKVWEDYYGIQMDIEADDNSDDRLAHFGMLVELNEDDVNELIAALEAFR